jgi:hypothetical protein
MRAQLLPGREQCVPGLFAVDFGNLQLEPGDREGEARNPRPVPHSSRRTSCQIEGARMKTVFVVLSLLPDKRTPIGA